MKLSPTVLSKSQTLALVAKALSKAESRRELVDSLWADLQRLSRMMSAWAKGAYTRIPWRTLAMATGALLYFVNPLDAIPDFLLGLGYLDDASVLAMVVASLKRDIERFERWETAQSGADARGDLMDRSEDATGELVSEDRV